jgi:LPXTG-motif cell wall-anchored protein
MKYFAAILFNLFLCTSVIAQTDSAVGTSALPGQVQSDVPAATTGTAPIDTGMPSGTGTTGTSGTTMEQAERNNESNSSFLWLIVGAAVLAGVIVLLRKKRGRS